jgi:hypothetical protein
MSGGCLGVSILQGPHQVALKSTNTGLLLPSTLFWKNKESPDVERKVQYYVSVSGRIWNFSSEVKSEAKLSITTQITRSF